MFISTCMFGIGGPENSSGVRARAVSNSLGKRESVRTPDGWRTRTSPAGGPRTTPTTTRRPMAALGSPGSPM